MIIGKMRLKGPDNGGQIGFDAARNLRNYARRKDGMIQAPLDFRGTRAQSQARRYLRNGLSDNSRSYAAARFV